jgi:hypothetical protein
MLQESLLIIQYVMLMFYGADVLLEMLAVICVPSIPVYLSDFYILLSSFGSGVSFSFTYGFSAKQRLNFRNSNCCEYVFRLKQFHDGKRGEPR